MIALVLEAYGALCFFSLIAFLVLACVAKLRPDLDGPEFDLDQLEKLRKLASGEQPDFDPQVGDLTYEDRPAPGPHRQGRSVLRSVTGDLGFPRAEMSESIRDNPNRRLSHAGVAIGDFALDP